jgi:beta-lactamase regulating signal transducer with metallopeptidase domain
MLVQFAFKSTVILAAALGVTAVMRRSSAATRHLVWASALLATLAVPAIVFFGPEWSLAARRAPAPQFEAQVFRQSDVTAHPLREPTAHSRSAQSDDEWKRIWRSMSAREAPGLTSVWLSGAAIGLARMVAGFFWAIRFARRARPVTDWTCSLAANRIAESLRITTPVALRMSAQASVPLTWGLWRRSYLFLPLDAEAWPATRRHAVLLHEMAHIRRRDCLVRSLAQAACVLQWFNPLAHLAFRRLRTEQERACDDVVLAAGMTATDYANHLLEIVRASRATALDQAALAMGRRSELEGRMCAILDNTRRRDASSRRTRLIAAAATAAVVVAIGALRLSAVPNTAVAPHVSGPQTVAGPERLDFSQVQWTRPIDEETRRRVAAVLSGLLGDSDGQVRDAAQQALDAIGDLPPGTVVVSSPCHGNCVVAGTMPSALIFEMKTRLAMLEIQSRDRTQRYRGVTRLMGRTESSAETLVQLLQDDDPQIRVAAAIHLDSVVFPGAVPGWIALLGDSDASLRERAAISLGAIGDPSAIDPLAATLINESNPDVRRQVVRSLGIIAAGGT